jgi:hypothetical protein
VFVPYIIEREGLIGVYVYGCNRCMGVIGVCVWV